MSEYVSVWWLPVGASRVKEWISCTLELSYIKAVVSHWMWVLGTGMGPSQRQSTLLRYLSSSSRTDFKKLIKWFNYSLKKCLNYKKILLINSLAVPLIPWVLCPKSKSFSLLHLLHVLFLRWIFVISVFLS